MNWQDKQDNQDRSVYKKGKNINQKIEFKSEKLLKIDVFTQS